MCGQYFKIVNITKKEFLHPHDFGEGLKLMEFGCSPTFAKLMAYLLRQSTGTGGGDIALDEEILDIPYYEKTKKWRHIKNPDYVKTEFMGRWANDQITIIGDYDDSTRRKPTRQQIREAEKKNRPAYGDNLYDDCDEYIYLNEIDSNGMCRQVKKKNPKYKNITKQVIEEFNKVCIWEDDKIIVERFRD